jgi:uncharacterized protein (DUF362 family)
METEVHIRGEGLSTPSMVGVVRAEKALYCQQPPFEPAISYPELAWPVEPSPSNPAYEGIRRLFGLLRCDAANFGNRTWNPLGWLIKPGETVVLKPNLLRESHPRDPQGWSYTLTHGSFIRAVADYVYIALRGEGKVVVCDAPQAESSFDQICKVLGLYALRSYYREKGVQFDLVDLRREEWESRDGVVTRRKELPGDPLGSVAFDLGASSRFLDHSGSGRYYGADYDAKEVNSHHHGGRHEYLLSRTVMQAHVFINLPKLKTHKKTGITVALKNLVGINADKNWLPHHTEGGPELGGDEFPSTTRIREVERAASKFLRQMALRSPAIGGRVLALCKAASRPVFGDSGKVIRAGNWFGNDTAWRMCLDLNTILFFGRLDSTMAAPTNQPAMRYMALVDGIVAGEGDGPLDPDPVPAGLILGGTNPVAVDSAAAVLMGFDPDKIPLLSNAFRRNPYALARGTWKDVQLISDFEPWTGRLEDIQSCACFKFRPHFGWEGHIERMPATVPR